MVTCPKCGYKEKEGEFCARCGARLQQKNKGPYRNATKPISPLIVLTAGGILALVGLILIVLIIGSILAIASGAVQSPTTAVIEAGKNYICGGQLSYSAQLTGSKGDGIPGQQVLVYVNNNLLEKLKTDQNGRFSSSDTIPSAWCGKQNTISLVYLGDLTHKKSNASADFNVQIPTSLSISVPTEAETGESVLINLSLTNSIDNTPVQNRFISVTDELTYNATTDSQGNVQVISHFNDTGAKSIRGNFAGDLEYLPSQSPLDVISVTSPACSDGTVVGQCSKQNTYYCNLQKQLVFDCSICGCTQGLVCSENQCITQEQAVGELISQLQNSVVFVTDSQDTGSGIVLDHKNGQTVILTNRHVIQDALGTPDVSITTWDNKTAGATDIRIAPNQMDFAVIYVDGTLGEPAKINYSEQLFQGEDVLAMGSPLGIQGSVSKGIISNFETEDTSWLPWSSGIATRYNTIQTDAPINPGNSGGGLFLTSDGDLAGINEFTTTLPSGQTAQGLNGAIEITDLQKLLPYDNWQEFNPIPRCSDGTEYGACSQVHIGYACSSGIMTPDCQTCGCQTGSYCPSSGACFSCYPSYTPYEDRNGNGFCCAPGYLPYDDVDGSGFCCPAGETAQPGKTCQ